MRCRLVALPVVLIGLAACGPDALPDAPTYTFGVTTSVSSVALVQDDSAVISGAITNATRNAPVTDSLLMVASDDPAVAVMEPVPDNPGKYKIYFQAAPSRRAAGRQGVARCCRRRLVSTVRPCDIDPSPALSEPCWHREWPLVGVRSVGVVDVVERPAVAHASGNRDQPADT
jgi:hypothetical protein